MIVSCCYAICFALPVVGAGLIPAVIPFALAGFANSGIAMWRVLFLRELCPEQNSTSLVAVSWFAPAPFVIAGTLTLGKILDMSGNSYGPVFLVLAAMALVSLVCCMLGIPEPRRAEGCDNSNNY